MAFNELNRIRIPIVKTALQTLLTIVAALSLLTGCGDNSGSKKTIMKVSIGVPESHFEYQAMVKFKEHLAQNTQIEVQIFPSNQLGSDQEALESMRLNVIQMNLICQKMSG